MICVFAGTDVERAIAECVRQACGRDSGEYYAVTLWRDGHIEQRCGIGPPSFGEDEYFGRPGAEYTVFVQRGIPDVDPHSEWTDENGE